MKIEEATMLMLMQTTMHQIQMFKMSLPIISKDDPKMKICSIEVFIAMKMELNTKYLHPIEGQIEIQRRKKTILR